MTSPRTGHEWTLWLVPFLCAAHAMEEYLTGWQWWARGSLGIAMPASVFAIMNGVLVLIAIAAARMAWRAPVFSLVVPVATLLNAILFHDLPSVMEHRAVPGFYTATFLYLPWSTFVIVGARRDGVAGRDVRTAFVIGAIVAVGVVLAARLLAPVTPT